MLFVFNVPPTAKVIMETGPQLKVSSYRLVEPGIEPATPGLQGKWLIHYTTAAPTSGNRYTISIENNFIITEFLLCVRQFGDQNKVFLHEQVSVSLEKWEALCNLIQYEAELMYTYGIIAF